MNPLQKKCILATAGFHLLLLLILFVGPGFFRRETPPVDLPMLKVIPLNAIDAALSSGVAKATPPPVTVVSHTPAASPASQHSTTANAVFAVRVAADNGSCWIQVRKTGIAGPIVYQTTMVQGQTHTFQASGALYVRLGVPAYVSITVRGRAPYQPAETLSNNYKVTKKGVVKL